MDRLLDVFGLFAVARAGNITLASVVITLGIGLVAAAVIGLLGARALARTGGAAVLCVGDDEL